MAPAVPPCVLHQVPFAQNQVPFMTQSGGLGSSSGAVPVVQPVPLGQPPAMTEVADFPLAKAGKCWKCSVDTHATKDCNAQHYCVVCDSVAHPTLRCPTLKLPKPHAFVGGPT
jgi:hypothetical protein